MARPDFGRAATPPVPHQLHDNGVVVDGDAVEGILHGLLAEAEAEAKSVDPLGFC